MNVAALHRDCAACLATKDAVSPPDCVLVMLHMCLVGGSTPESIRDDLCFAHRRLFEDSVKSAKEGA